MAFNHLVVLTVVGSASWMWIQNFIIFASGGVGKNGSTVADTSVAFPIVPLALICGAAHVINAKSNGLLLNDAPVVYIVLFGFIFAKASSRLIVSTCQVPNKVYTVHNSLKFLQENLRLFLL